MQSAQRPIGERNHQTSSATRGFSCGHKTDALFRSCSKLSTFESGCQIAQYCGIRRDSCAAAVKIASVTFRHLSFASSPLFALF